MYELRDKVAADPAVELIVHTNPEAQAKGINPFDHGPLHTDMWKTEGLKQALDQHGFDAAFGGARRDEEKSRAKERIFSFRNANHRWDPKRPAARAVVALQRPQEQGRERPGLPLSNWTELDVWQYILREKIEIVPLYFSDLRPTVVRDGLILMVDDDRFPLNGEEPKLRKVRFRTLGCYPLTGAVESEAATRRGGRRRNASHHHLRAAGPGDRQGFRRGEHGEEEAGGLFLMSRALDEDRDLIASDVSEWLARHERKEMLRFITCGSVDDGKSTLIGRLLYDCRQIFDDQLETLEAESKKIGTQGAKLDFALLVDGLSAEREQGITIDVAYRFFASEKRKFIVADTPGHEQYTRNMVTGASTADVAVLLIDARKGVLTQTRRHSYLAQLVGIRHFVLAVTKMDLVDYDEEAFDTIRAAYGSFAEKLGIDDWQAIPVSGVAGDNVTSASDNMPWFEGPTLLEYLETVEIDANADAGKPLRMPVQWVNRPDQSFRGFAGQIASGTMGPGTEARVLPSGRTTRIARIVTFEGDLDEAVAGQSVTVTLEDEVDCSRGDVIAAAADPPQSADQFERRSSG
jgi:sulfate adenylyltransferase large subunit